MLGISYELQDELLVLLAGYKGEKTVDLDKHIKTFGNDHCIVDFDNEAIEKINEMIEKLNNLGSVK